MCYVVSMDDYETVTSEVLDFAAEQTMACHDVNIIDDNVCENGSNEIFFLDLVLGSGEQPIDVVPEQAMVIIDDTNERECGEFTNIIFIHNSHKHPNYMYVHM